MRCRKDRGEGGPVVRCSKDLGEVSKDGGEVQWICGEVQQKLW